MHCDNSVFFCLLLLDTNMNDWVARLDSFLQFNEAEVLHHKGKVTAAIEKAFAESEFEKYRVIQDRQYQSDFDRLVASTEDKD